MSSKKSAKKSNVAVFVSKNRSVISRVTNLFQSVVNQETKYRVSIKELAMSLVQLRNLCKSNHVSWQKVATEHIGIPIRSANRYIALADSTQSISAAVIARVTAAGFDASTKRVQTRIKTLGTVKIARMSAVELAVAFKKKGTSRKATLTPEQRFQNTIKSGIQSYLKSQINTDTTKSEALEVVQRMLNTLKVRTSGLTLVAKAA